MIKNYQDSVVIYNLSTGLTDHNMALIVRKLQ